MGDSLSLLIKSRIDDSAQQIKSLETQIEALSSKIKSAISVKLNIDSKDIQFLTKEIAQNIKKAKDNTEQLQKSTSKIAYDRLENSLKKQNDIKIKLLKSGEQETLQLNNQLKYYNAIEKKVKDRIYKNNLTDKEREINLLRIQTDLTDKLRLKEAQLIDKRNSAKSNSTSESSNSNYNVLSPQDIEIQVKKINNSLDKLKVNKDKVFADSGVIAEVSKLKDAEVAFKKGAISAKQYSLQMDNVRTKVAQVSGVLRNTTKDGYSLSEMLSLAGKKVLIWTASTQLIFGTWRAIKSGISTISEIESNMTSIARVMDDVNFQMDKYRNSLFEISKSTGSAFKDSADVALRFAQAGYNVVDSLKLTETAMAAVQTAELDAQNATESMIGIMSQWNMQASEMPLLLDKINKISDEYTLTSQDLVDGLLRSSAASRNLGLSIDETISLLTVLRETSGRTGREVGNALNSILSYITRGKTLDVLETAGIQVYTDNTKTQFRNFMGVLQDISTQWNGLSAEIQNGFIQAADEAGLYNEELADTLGLEQEWSDVQKRDVSNAAAGTYRRNYFLGLMQSMTKTKDVLEDLQGAEGYTGVELEKRVETLSSKFTVLQNSLKELATSFGDGGILGGLKGLTDDTTSLVNTFSIIVDKIGGLNAIIAIGAGGLSLYSKEFREFGSAIGTSIPGISNLNEWLIKTKKNKTDSVEATKKYIEQLRKATTENTSFVTATGKTITTTKGLKTELNAAKLSLFGLQAAEVAATVGAVALQTAITMGLSLAITGIITLISNFINKADITKQKISDLNQEISALKDKKKEFEDLYSEYETLNSKVSLSTEEHKRFLEIQNSIASISDDLVLGYDAQGNAILKNSEYMKEYIRNQEIMIANEAKKQKGLYVDNLSEIYKRDSFSKSFSGSSSLSISPLLTFSDVFNSFSDVKDKTTKQLKEYLDLLNSGELKKSQDYLKDFSDSQKLAFIEFSDDSKEFQNSVKGLSVAVDDYSTLPDTLKKAVDKTVGEKFNLLDYISSDLSKKEYADEIQKYTRQLAEVLENPEVKKAFQNFQDEQSKLSIGKSTTESVEEFRQTFLNAVKSIVSDGNLLKVLSDNIFPNITQSSDNTGNSIYNFSQSINSSNDNLNSFSESVSTYNDILSKLHGNQEITIDDILKWQKTFPEILKYMDIENGTIKIQEGAINKLIDAKKNEAIVFQNTEKQKLETVKTTILERLKYYGLEADVLAKSAEDVKKATEKAYLDKANALGVSPNNPQQMSELKALQDQINNYRDTKDTIDKSIELIMNGKFDSNVKTNTSSSSSSKSQYTPSTEQKALKELLDANKITLQEYYTRLLSLEKSQYSDYADKSVAQLESMLRSKDEKVAKRTEEYLALQGDISSSGDNIFSNALSSTKKLFDDGSWGIDKYISYLNALKTTLNKLGINLTTEQIKELNTAIEQASLDKISISFEKFSNTLKPANETLAELEHSYKLLGEGNIEAKEKNLNAQLSLKTKMLNVINSQIAEYQKLLKSATSDDIKNLYQSEIDKLIAQSRQLEVDAYERANQIRLDAIEELKTAESNRHDAVMKSLDEELDREKERHESRIDALDEEMDKYQEYIDTQLRGLDDIYRKEDFQRNLDSQNKEILAKQQEINAISLDTSAEGLARKAQLEKEMLELQTKKEDAQRDYTRQETKDLYNDLLRLKKDNIDDQKKAEDSLTKNIVDNIEKQKKAEEEKYKNFQLNIDQMLKGTQSFYNEQDNISKMSIDKVISYYKNLNTEVNNFYDNLIKKLKEAQKVGMENPFGLNPITEIPTDNKTPTPVTAKPVVDESQRVQMAQYLALNGHSATWQNGSLYIDNKKIDTKGSGVENINGHFEGTIADIKKLLKKHNITFDQGGTAYGKGFLFKDTIKPEEVLSPDNTATFRKLVEQLPSIKDMLKTVDIMKNYLPNISKFSPSNLVNNQKSPIQITAHTKIVANDGIDENRLAKLVETKVYNNITNKLVTRGII